MGTATLVIVVAVVVVPPLVGYLAARRSRSRRREERERGRKGFAEYERAAREKELRRRRGSVERRVEPLSGEGRCRYEGRWGEVERVFVDDPERSTETADRAISDVLHERNCVADDHRGVRGSGGSAGEGGRGRSAPGHPQVPGGLPAPREAVGSPSGR